MKVSVLMITYNQEEYIAQAVESALKQEVNFEYEIVIGEDNSTDNTLKILQSYKENYPHIIKLLPAESNMGFQKNFIRTWKECRGEYVAILEGDDYWTSQFKLQKQVDFIDSFPDYSMCFHDAIVYEDVTHSYNEHSDKLPVKKDFYTTEDLIERNFIFTCTTLFRKSILHQFPDWIYNTINFDRALYIISAQSGKIGYIDEKMAVYRKHSEGVWTGLNYVGRLQSNIYLYESINDFLNYKYNEKINLKIEELWKRLHDAQVENGFQFGLENMNLSHVEGIFNNWPEYVNLSRGRKNKIIGDIYQRLFFEYYSSKQLEKARYCWFKLLQFSPIKLLNRGVLILGIEIEINPKAANLLRRLF
jgi:glycosyltransferase involved in cell wall biosynthesis